MTHLPWHRTLLTAALVSAFSAPGLARPASLHWEKIHVAHVLPSQVFARLGLTHSTKNGLTRDGKRGVPDPNFPPGLTDVVPYDTDRLLIVRGTPGGVTLFRSRVATADVQTQPLHLKAELFRRQDAVEAPVGSVEQDGILDGVPATVSLGDGETPRVYQIKTHANPDGSVWVSCRISLPLPPPLAVSADGPAPTAVFVPDRVWTDPLSRKVKMGETAAFDDLAAARQTASRKLGLTGTDSAEDYTLRLTLSPMPPPSSQP